MKNKTVKVMLCGASLSGNLGGQAMYDAIIDELSKSVKLEVTIVSKYPEDDRLGCEERGYKLLPFPTVKQFFLGGLFYCIGNVFKFLHLPYKSSIGG